ncbi:MAG: hypothetical protein LBV08_03340 [Clostridiales bacterium]|jgi:DNA-binding transcriptional regulator GbsR (MarR family)|nr:hypothetical protein [Clostridiales bacterium]
MSIRPVDLQAGITRSNEVSRLNSLDASRPELFRQQFKEKLARDIKDNEQTILEAEEKGQVVDKDGNNKNKYFSEKKDKGEKNKKGPYKKNNPLLSMFDKSV